MNDIQFTVDTTEFARMVKYFSQQDWYRVKRRALTRAGNDIRKDAKQRFKSKLPAATKRSDKYKDRLIDAIRFSKMKNTGSGELNLVVHTMGSNKKGSGTFRARFFEKGTNDRVTRKGYTDSLGRHYPQGQNRGRLQPPLQFFHDAVSNFNKAEHDMMKIIEEEIIKLNNKKF